MKALLFLALFMGGQLALATSKAATGTLAPAFDVTDATGNMQKLTDYKGKWVVLEWFNKDCPYVKKTLRR